MDKTDVFCFYGFDSSDVRKEKLSAIGVSKTVFSTLDLLCRFPFVLLCCPSQNCCWVKGPSALYPMDFQKIKGINFLFDDYPFLRSLYEKTDKR